MRVFVFFCLALCVAAFARAGDDVPLAKKSKSVATADDLVVHEWGTFTSVSGSDGVRMEFRPLVDSDLPTFVLNRARQAGVPVPPFTKLDYRVFQRMETPVTYFYTSREREVRVKVGFPRGLLTEFYPPVERMQPKFDWVKRAAVSDSELDWGRVTLLPTDRLRTRLETPGLADRVHELVTERLTPASDESHYAYARETDSALVHVRRERDPKRPQAPVGDFFEKFLFYRGVGNFTLPLAVEATEQGEFHARNDGVEAIRSLFLVSVQGGEVRFRRYESLDGRGRLTMNLAGATGSVESLCDEVERALVGEGLYPREAAAMVKTWRQSWFEEEGVRLFYMLPTRVTDELLPLTIEPRPRETVRVMVGRMELMTPGMERRLVALLRANAAARIEWYERVNAERNAVREGRRRADQVDETPLAIPEEVLALGRFAEPALVRAKFFAKEPTLRTEAELLLAEMIRHWSKDEEVRAGGG